MKVSDQGERKNRRAALVAGGAIEAFPKQAFFNPSIFPVPSPSLEASSPASAAVMAFAYCCGPLRSSARFDPSPATKSNGQVSTPSRSILSSGSSKIQVNRGRRDRRRGHWSAPPTVSFCCQRTEKKGKVRLETSGYEHPVRCRGTKGEWANGAKRARRLPDREGPGRRFRRVAFPRVAAAGPGRRRATAFGCGFRVRAARPVPRTCRSR